jgi:chromosome partitioning protein
MALIAAERYLVPVLLHPLSINSVREVLTTVKSMQNRKVEVAEFAGVVPTMYDRVRVVSRELLAYISDAFPNGLTWPAIPTDTRAVEAPNYGQTLWEYAPTCRAIMGIQQDNGETFGGYAKLVEDLLALAESEENNG